MVLERYLVRLANTGIAPFLQEPLKAPLDLVYVDMTLDRTLVDVSGRRQTFQSKIDMVFNNEMNYLPITIKVPNTRYFIAAGVTTRSQSKVGAQNTSSVREVEVRTSSQQQKPSKMIESQETPSPDPDIYKQPIKNKSKRTLKTDNPPQVQKDNVKTRTLTPQQELKQFPNNGKDTVVETIQQSPDKHVEPPNPPFNTLSSILLHLSYACRSQEVLYHTFKHKAFKGLPTIHTSLPYICIICINMKMSRLRKLNYAPA